MSAPDHVGVVCPGPDDPNGARIAHALNTAALARLTLSGAAPNVGGFWRMPEGKHFVQQCWRGNMEMARRLIRQGAGA